MVNRLLIVQPSYYKSRTDRTVRLRRREVVPLVLPYLAAPTPRDWKVQLVDKILTPLDLDAAVDVVASGP